MTTQTLLLNYWYAAMTFQEVRAKATFARTMLDEPIALFNNADAAISALEDCCPQKNAALHRAPAPAPSPGGVDCAVSSPVLPPA